MICPLLFSSLSNSARRTGIQVIITCSALEADILSKIPGIRMMMEPKPEFLGRQFATSFEDLSVAESYRYRPPFPPQTFEIINQLIRGEPRRVLDAGCGTGALARHLVHIAESVDAVDASQAMIDQGKNLPDGKHPHLNWILGRIEDVPLTGPYSLITAGNSLHWMDWDVVMPLFGKLLSPNAVLVIVESASSPPPWQGAMLDIFRRYSTNQGFQAFHLHDELVRRGLFSEQGQRQTIGKETVVFPIGNLGSKLLFL